MISFMRGPWGEKYFGVSILLLVLFFSAPVLAQSPFQFPTANHYLYTPGAELKFFAPTDPDKPWTSGSFGCVRDYGHRMHEGLDIRHLQTNKRGESVPTPSWPLQLMAQWFIS